MKKIILIIALTFVSELSLFAQWAALNSGFNAEISNIVKIGNEILVSTKSNGVYYSGDETNWEQRNSGLANLKVYAMESENGELIAGTYGGGVFFSSDKGVSWTAKNTGISLPYIYSVEKSGTDVFAGSGGFGMYGSTNSGDSWSVIYPSTYLVNEIYKNNNKIYAGVGPYILRSTDNGVIWNPVVTSNTTILKIRTIPQPDETDHIYVAGLDAFYYSLSNGVSWVKKNIGGTNDFTIYGNNIFAATSGGIFYLSTDLGVNFSSINDNLPNPTEIKAILIDGDYIYAGSTTGIVYKRKLSDLITGIDDFAQAQPSFFQLMQNYPNPFNPTTSIKYFLPEQQFVSLKIFDILGNEVTTLVNENKPAGNYEVEFDANNLSTGVYFYQLRAGNFAETKKMLLMK